MSPIRRILSRSVRRSKVIQRRNPGWTTPSYLITFLSKRRRNLRGRPCIEHCLISSLHTAARPLDWRISAVATRFSKGKIQIAKSWFNNFWARISTVIDRHILTVVRPKQFMRMLWLVVGYTTLIPYLTLTEKRLPLLHSDSPSKT